MAPLERLTAADLRRVVTTYRDVLRGHAEELNRLNVYPVPDGDTGTNLALTLESVCAELDGAAPSMGAVCRALSHGSLMGARGNSGVILSQILRSFAEECATVEAVGPAELTAALRRGSDAAYKAVLRPVEGTILTVAAAAASAAETELASGGSLVAVLDESAAAAAHAVAQTPELLPVLAAAGVVDAGGRGFELLLAAFATVVDARPVPVSVAPPDAARAVAPAVVASDGPRYEVMFLLEAPDDAITRLEARWADLGDSIVVVGGDGLWNCHVHADDIGAAIEAGIAVGTPSRIRVTDLVEQVHEEAESRLAAPATSLVTVPTAVVAVANGRGVRELLRASGAHHVVAGGQSMNPSTADLVAAVQACAADGVVVLPSNRNVVPAARQAVDLAARAVAVVATSSVVESLAALVAYDPEASLADNEAAMTAAAGRVRSGEVTRAVRDAETEIGGVTEGQFLALTRAGVCAAAATLADAAGALAERLLEDGGELLTILVGDGVAPSDVDALVARLARAHTDLEIEVHQGEQPLYPFVMGVE